MISDAHGEPLTLPYPSSNSGQPGRVPHTVDHETSPSLLYSPAKAIIYFMNSLSVTDVVVSLAKQCFITPNYFVQ